MHPGVQETFGLVTLESQACGTPVVGIRGSYMDRIVFSDLGSWAAENRPESLAEAIERMSRQDLRAIGAAQQRHRGGTVQLAARVRPAVRDLPPGHRRIPAGKSR